MTAIYDFILHVYSTIPAPIIYMLISWLMSVAITQQLKFLMPLNWYPDIRNNIAQVTAFTVAFVTMFYLLPTNIGFFLGVLVGIFSPLAYALAILFIEERWPKVADILSADVRGMIYGDRRSAQPLREPKQ